MEYFKLKLDNCEYWQSKEMNNGKKEFTKQAHELNENRLLNVIFLQKENENEYTEFESRKKLIFNENEIIEPKGIKVPLSNITPCSYREILLTYKIIQINGLTDKYRQIIKDLLINSPKCEKVIKEKEISLCLKRY